jgi:hypothetical protein
MPRQELRDVPWLFDAHDGVRFLLGAE